VRLWYEVGKKRKEKYNDWGCRPTHYGLGELINYVDLHRLGPLAPPLIRVKIKQLQLHYWNNSTNRLGNKLNSNT
jgi:hypothetical protein